MQKKKYSLLEAIFKKGGCRHLRIPILFQFITNPWTLNPSPETTCICIERVLSTSQSTSAVALKKILFIYNTWKPRKVQQQSSNTNCWLTVIISKNQITMVRPVRDHVQSSMSKKRKSLTNFVRPPSSLKGNPRNIEFFFGRYTLRPLKINFMFYLRIFLET